MSSCDLLSKIREILESSKLKSHEGGVSDLEWDNKTNKYLSFCNELKTLLTSQTLQLNSPSLPYLLTFLGGILGNLLSSRKLHSNAKLTSVAQESLDLLVTNHNVNSVRNLLLSSVTSNDSCSRSLAQHMLQICMVYLGRTEDKNSDDPLTTSPLFRDTLIWLCSELDYPELTGEEFISMMQPLGLRLTEDYRPHIQISGLRVLQDLASKAHIADWRQSNRAEAVISQLLEHRIGCDPGSPDQLLSEFYSTLLVITNLLSKEKSLIYYNRITERLLFDLLMEAKVSRQLIFLRNLLYLMDLLKTSFVLHTRRFLHLISVILLGPRKPKTIYFKGLNENLNEDDIYISMLNCIHQFILLSWPIISPDLLPDLISPIIAFIDLISWDRNDIDCESIPEQSKEIALILKEIFRTLIKLESSILSKVLLPLCDSVCALKFYLPN